MENCSLRTYRQRLAATIDDGFRVYFTRVLGCSGFSFYRRRVLVRARIVYYFSGVQSKFRINIQKFKRERRERSEPARCQPKLCLAPQIGSAVRSCTRLTIF